MYLSFGVGGVAEILKKVLDIYYPALVLFVVTIL